jgi:hypothetical protein
MRPSAMGARLPEKMAEIGPNMASLWQEIQCFLLAEESKKLCRHKAFGVRFFALPAWKQWDFWLCPHNLT